MCWYHSVAWTLIMSVLGGGYATAKPPPAIKPTSTPTMTNSPRRRTGRVRAARRPDCFAAIMVSPVEVFRVSLGNASGILSAYLGESPVHVITLDQAYACPEQSIRQVRPPSKWRNNASRRHH